MSQDAAGRALSRRRWLCSLDDAAGRDDFEKACFYVHDGWMH
jgi:hypothetical protein